MSRKKFSKSCRKATQTGSEAGLQIVLGPLTDAQEQFAMVVGVSLASSWRRSQGDS